jgi:hypothetical protein
MTLRAKSFTVLLATAAVSAGAFWLLREHWGHVLGYAPYLLFLACPLMHLFHGHGGHDHGQGAKPPETP